MRSARHDGFDRVVLEFAGGAAPGYRVSYVEPPITADGSGAEIPVPGAAFLEVRATPASGVDLSGAEPRETYPGPDRVAPAGGGGVVTEVVQTGDFEGQLAWTIGLQERVPFGVAVLEEPTRLVVDLYHDVLEPVGAGDTADSVVAGEGPQVAVTDVRLGAHPGFDRMVFEVAGEGEAGWRIGYTDDPRAQGSGAPIDVPGDAVLGVTLTNIALPGDAPEGVQPWGGPDRQQLPGASTLQALVEDTVYEGHHTFFAGLDAERPFAVSRLSSPQRIVVDVLAQEGRPPVDLGSRCEHPDGFALSYPGSWSTNTGDVLPPCSRFAPQPFTLTSGTDERTAPIAASVEPVPYSQVSAPQEGAEESRSATIVDGRQGVRIQRTATGEGLWPEGTRTTTYAIDLGADVQGGPATLVVNTVGLPEFDYDRNVRVLDHMVHTLDITAGSTG
ncbi:MULTISPECIES: AMIN-like domain-containing (lipo)protein [unclassified Modestobacter]